MKKIIIAVFLSTMLIFTGCAANNIADPATPDSSATAVDPSTEVPTEASTEPPVDTTALLKEMSGTYSCSTGTKGGTVLYLSTDGTFVGSYGYFQTAVGDEEAPNGVHDQSAFSGSLQNIKFVDTYKYFVDISELEYQTETGTEEIINGARYRNTIAEHIASNDQFYIFTPDALCSQIPDDGLDWLRYNGAMPEDEEGPVGKFLLYNIRSGETFFQSEHIELGPGETMSNAESIDEYTGENLLSMNVTDILKILNHDISLDYMGEYSYYTGGVFYLYFYNFEALPGFVFYVYPIQPTEQLTEEDLNNFKNDILAGDYELQAIGITDGARLNDKISSDMTYSQVSYAIGDYTLRGIAGTIEITQDVTSSCNNGSNAFVKYDVSEETIKYVEDNNLMYLPSSYLLEENPKISRIVISNN